MVLLGTLRARHGLMLLPSGGIFSCQASYKHTLDLFEHETTGRYPHEQQIFLAATRQVWCHLPYTSLSGKVRNVDLLISIPNGPYISVHRTSARQLHTPNTRRGSSRGWPSALGPNHAIILPHTNHVPRNMLGKQDCFSTELACASAVAELKARLPCALRVLFTSIRRSFSRGCTNMFVTLH